MLGFSWWLERVGVRRLEGPHLEYDVWGKYNSTELILRGVLFITPQNVSVDLVLC